jgi:uncharacterized membrane protein
MLFSSAEAGVPFLIVDDVYLIGSTDIPEKFPALVESYLAQGGVDWPDVPGLTESLNGSGTPQAPTPTSVPVVHAVMFYRSACSHCMKITEEVIPPLREKYGTQLELFSIDVSTPEGDDLYDVAIERFDIQSFGVPTLILGDEVLVGSTEIEQRFAGILEGYLMEGGIGWPDIAGLQEVIAEANPQNDSAQIQTPAAVDAVSPASSEPATSPDMLLAGAESADWTARFAQDLTGNSFAVVVLLGMLGSSAWTVVSWRKTTSVEIYGFQTWLMPMLCIIGFGVAGYLSYIETTQTTAVCGPVGDCNAVQQSEYARLFGILPIGIVGLFGYAVILILWLVTRYASQHLADMASMSVFAMTGLGTLFSIYLTFLEPFVIGATCAWCLTSAVLMTTLMLLALGPAKMSWARRSRTLAGVHVARQRERKDH